MDFSSILDSEAVGSNEWRYQTDSERNNVALGKSTGILASGCEVESAQVMLVLNCTGVLEDETRVSCRRPETLKGPCPFVTTARQRTWRTGGLTKTDVCLHISSHMSSRLTALMRYLPFALAGWMATSCTS